MRKLYLGNGDKQFKFADTTTEINLSAFDDESAATLTTDAKVRIKNDSGYLLGLSASIADNRATITSGQLSQLPVGNYLLELWDTVNGGTAIYPSDGFLALQINENVTGLSGGIVSSITVDDFIKHFSDLSQQLKKEVSDAVSNGLKGNKGDPGKDFRIVKTFPSIAQMSGDGFSDGDFTMIASDVNDPDNGKLYVWNGTSFAYIADLSGSQGIKGDTGTVDNTRLISAPAFQSLQAQVNNSAVGTNLLINTSSSATNGKTMMPGAGNDINGVYSRTDSYEQVVANSTDEFYYRFMIPNTNKLYGLTPGATYTLSGSGSHTAGELKFRAQYSAAGSSWGWAYPDNLSDLEIPVSDGSVFTPFSYTFTIPVGATGIYFGLQNYDYTAGSLFRFKNMKLEKGSVATDRCLNPSEILTQSDYAKIKAAIVALGGALS